MALKVEISAETVDQAYAILDPLLEARLVTGGQIIGSPARFLWKGDIVDMEYFTLTSFTVEAHKEAIIEVAEAASEEEVPMICFFEFDCNEKLDKWITETVK